MLPEHDLNIADALLGPARLPAHGRVVRLLAEEAIVEFAGLFQQLAADLLHARLVGQLFSADAGQHLIDGGTGEAEILLVRARCFSARVRSLAIRRPLALNVGQLLLLLFAVFRCLPGRVQP